MILNWQIFYVVDTDEEIRHEKKVRKDILEPEQKEIAIDWQTGVCVY